MHEFEIIKKYFSKLSLDNKNSLKLNDDVFFDKSKELVISVDTYIDKSHFFDFKDPDLVIKKILRSSISDLICKGVKPKYYFISGSGNKKTFTKSNLKKISQSLKQEQKKFGIHISGGDTVFSNKLSFTIISVGFSPNITSKTFLILILFSIIIIVIIKKYNQVEDKYIENIEIFPKLNDNQSVQSFNINGSKLYLHVKDTSNNKTSIIIYNLKNSKKVGSIIIKDK